MTLQALAEESGLSSSMLSLVERGLAAPSIGSLILLKEALGTEISEFFAATRSEEDVVVRSEDAIQVVVRDEVVHRILRRDTTAGICISISEYAPGRTSPVTGDGTPGTIHGLMLEGALKVEVEGKTYAIGAGDLISYRAEKLRRTINEGSEPARTIWFKIEQR